MSPTGLGCSTSSPASLSAFKPIGTGRGLPGSQISRNWGSHGHRNFSCGPLGQHGGLSFLQNSPVHRKRHHASCSQRPQLARRRESTRILVPQGSTNVCEVSSLCDWGGTRRMGMMGCVASTTHATHVQSASRRRDACTCMAAAVEGDLEPEQDSMGQLGLRDRVQGLLWSGFDPDIWALVLPSLVSLMIEPAMSLVDSIIIGRIGAAALGGCGISVYLCSGVTLLFSFLAMVSTPAVASALARQDVAQISEVTADGVWLALGLGTAIAIGIGLGCPWMVNAMGATPEVATQAIAYLRMRVFGAPAQLLMYVATGIFRGCRDTRTGARAAVVGFVVNLSLDLTLILGLHAGVAGAAAATSISQWVNAGLMYRALVARGLFKPSDMAVPPRWSRLGPVLRQGASLQARSVSIWFVMLNATMAAMRCGTAALAAHEILRSCWSLCMYGFWALNASSQALVATYVGRRDLENARRVLMRTTQIGMLVGVVLVGAFWVPRDVLPFAFTTDLAVAEQVRSCLPIVICALPIEAMERALEGGLIACSGEVDWVARNTIVTSAFCLLGLVAVHKLQLGLPAVWCAIKLITFGRVAGAIARYANPESTLQGFRVLTLRPISPAPVLMVPSPASGAQTGDA